MKDCTEAGKEHVWGKWARMSLPVAKLDGTETGPQRVHTMTSRTCSSCGWVDYRDPLTPLLEPQKKKKEGRDEAPNLR